MNDKDELLRRTAGLKLVADKFGRAYEQSRQASDAVLSRGEKHKPRAGTGGAAWGTVEKTDPKPVVTVTNPAALADWMAGRYPEQVEAVYEVAASADELVSVLAVHAPHMLRRANRLTKQALADMTERTVAGKQPVGPGGELDVPGITYAPGSPVTRCITNKDALDEVVAEVIAQWRSGELDLEAPAPRQQIEGTVVDGDVD